MTRRIRRSRVSRVSHGAMAALLTFAIAISAGALVSAASAVAESNPQNAFVRNPQTWYAYANAGETVSSTFIKQTAALAGGTLDTRIVVTRPDGSVAATCEVSQTDPINTTCSFSEVATATGAWSIAIVRPAGAVEPAAGYTRFTWDISVTSGGTPVTGRVWSELYRQADSQNWGTVNLSLWYLTDQGYLYEVDRPSMIGIDSDFAANAFGVVDPSTCATAHSSTANVNTQYKVVTATTCPYTPYKIFFSSPASDLPAQVTLPSGRTTWLLRAPEEPTLDSASFAPASAGSRAGTVTAAFSNFEGSATVQVDADGDGSFTGPLDRSLPMAVMGGTGQIEFDGMDAAGTPIPVTTAITFRVLASGFAEIHFTDNDVEYLPNGIAVERRNGPADGTQTRVFWDDTFVTLTANDPQADLRCSTTPQIASGTGGVDSTGGVHGWDLGDCVWVGQPYINSLASDMTNGGAWGNNRAIDNWAVIDASLHRDVLVPALEPGFVVTKAANPESGSAVSPGQTVTYTVTGSNTGATVLDPVQLTDDLSGVLASAAYDNDAAATVGGADAGPVTLDETTLSWSGALQVGQSVTLTYSVTVHADAPSGSTLRNRVTGSATPPSGDPLVPPAAETDNPVMGDAAPPPPAPPTIPAPTTPAPEAADPELLAAAPGAELASTGVAVWPWVSSGIAALAAGAVLLLAGLRRERLGWRR